MPLTFNISALGRDDRPKLYDNALSKTVQLKEFASAQHLDLLTCLLLNQVLTVSRCGNRGGWTQGKCDR